MTSGHFDNFIQSMDEVSEDEVSGSDDSVYSELSSELDTEPEEVVSSQN